MCRVLLAVKDRVESECCVDAMERAPWRVQLEGIKPYILIDADHDQAPNQEPDKKGDYIVVGLIERDNNSNTSEWVVPVETKGGALGKKAHAQLQASANLLNGLIPNNLTFEFQPVVFFDSGAKKVVLDYFKKTPIRWRGQRSEWGGMRFVRSVSRNRALSGNRAGSHGLHLKNFLLSPPSK